MHRVGVGKLRAQFLQAFVCRNLRVVGFRLVPDDVDTLVNGLAFLLQLLTESIAVLVQLFLCLFRIARAVCIKHQRRNNSDDSRCKEDVRVCPCGDIERLLCSREQSEFLSEHHYKPYALGKVSCLFHHPYSHQSCLVCSVCSRYGQYGVQEHIIMFYHIRKQVHTAYEHALLAASYLVEHGVPCALQVGQRTVYAL